MKMQPKIEPQLRENGLEWADVLPMLETIGSVGELQAALDDPTKMKEKLLRAI